MAKCESIARTVSSLTLDGRRLSVDLHIDLRRPMNQSDADLVGDDVARAVDAILSEQIVQGQVALTPGELETMTLSRAKQSAAKIGSLRVLRLRAAAQAPAISPPVSPRPMGAPLGQTSMTPAPSRPLPSTRTHPTPAAGRPIAAPSSPARPAPASDQPRPAPSSRTMPSVGPEALMDAEAVGAKAGIILRDAAARTLLAGLSAIVAKTADRFSVLEGNPPSADLRRATAACLAATIYAGLKLGGASHRAAASIVESACRHAAFTESPSATEIGQFIASASPAVELAKRIASLLDVPHEEPLILSAVSPHAAALGERFRVVSKGGSLTPSVNPKVGGSGAR